MSYKQNKGSSPSKEMAFTTIEAGMSPEEAKENLKNTLSRLGITVEKNSSQVMAERLIRGIEERGFAVLGESPDQTTPNTPKD